VKTKSGKIINIEIQVVVTPDMRERIVFYDSKLITEQINSGDTHSVIKKVISIVITGERFIPEHEIYHDTFTFYSKKTNTELTDLIEIHTLELPKLPEKSDGTNLWNWMKFIAADSEEELKVLAQNAPQMNTPIEKLLELNQDSEARILFEAREKQRRDNMARERHAKIEGKKEGIIEMTKKLKAKNMPIEDIIDMTGFTIEYIKSL